MHVGICTISLRLHDAHSLKDKRRVVKALKDRLHHRFNVSVAEAAHHDQHQSAEIAVAAISNDSRQVNVVLSKVARFAEQNCPGEFVDYSIEIL